MPRENLKDGNNKKLKRVLICIESLPIKLNLNEEGVIEASFIDIGTGTFEIFPKELEYNVIYIGQLNTEEAIPLEDRPHVIDILSKLNPICIPVFVQPDIRYKMRQKFCKKILWPIFHNIVDVQSICSSADEQEGAYLAYSDVNEEFCNVVTNNHQEGDVVWIHNYHLLLLPSFLNRRIPYNQIAISIFLHTPFPSSEIFRALPFRDEILKGILGADHVGFNLFEYCRHFLTCCKRIFGLRVESHKGGRLGVEFNGKHVIVSSRVLGLDVERVIESVHSNSILLQPTENLIKILGINHNTVSSFSIISGIESVERIKGITLKLLAFEYLLENYPSWASSVILIQIGLVDDIYNLEKGALTNQINSIVQRINQNKKYKRVDGVPLVIYREVLNLPFLERISLWRMSNVYFNTSIREGMNVFPSEYVTTRSTSVQYSEFLTGVALVSEFSGSALMLSGVLRINPWQTEKVAEILDRALHMGREEQTSRLEQDSAVANNNTKSIWFHSVLSDIQESVKCRDVEDILSITSEGLGVQAPLGFKTGFKQLDFDGVIGKYKSAKKRLILLDSRGTLMPLSNFSVSNKKFRPRNMTIGNTGKSGFVPRTSTSVHTKETVLPLGLNSYLETICNDPLNTVVIAGGTTRTEIYKQFGKIKKLSFAAEHGFYINWWKSRVLIGGHDPVGNTGWELLGGCRLGGKAKPGTPSCIININNESNKGVWFRAIRFNGGFHGVDIPSFTKNLTLATHSDVYALAYMYWTRGDEGKWRPRGVVPIESGCTVTISLSGNISCQINQEDSQIKILSNLSPFVYNQLFKVASDLIEYVQSEWRTLTTAIMKVYQERTCGAYLEYKDTSILWRYRDTDPEFGTIQAKELLLQLEKSLKDFHVEVLTGKDYVEVRPEGVNKGALAQFVLSAIGGDVDYVLAIGDDTADEFMFNALDEEPIANVITCTVGKKSSAAKYYVDDHTEVFDFISSLAECSKECEQEEKDTDSIDFNIDTKDTPIMEVRKHPPKINWQDKLLKEKGYVNNDNNSVASSQIIRSSNGIIRRVSGTIQTLTTNRRYGWKLYLSLCVFILTLIGFRLFKKK